MQHSSTQPVKQFFTKVAATSGGAVRFRPTPTTVGPWSPKLQHGGPPCALIAHHVEAAARAAQMPFVCRMTFLFFRPVPVDGTLFVEAAPLRVGQKAAHFGASLFVDSPKGPVEALRATALSVAPRVIPGVPEPKHRDLMSRTPSESPAAKNVLQLSHHFGYFDAYDTRVSKGVHGKGPTETWVRHVDGFEMIEGHGAPSPLERVAAWVDSTGGMSSHLNFATTSYVNADMTINLVRPLRGEWCGLRARTDTDSVNAAGLATGDIFDEEGFIGSVSQQQILDTR